MGMTIEDAMNHIKYGIIENNYPLQRDLGIEACNVAMNTMRKYKKIVQIMERTVDDGTSMYDTLQEIEEVIEDGKID